MEQILTIIGPYGWCSMVLELLLFSAVSLRQFKLDRSFFLRVLGSVAVCLPVCAIVYTCQDRLPDETGLYLQLLSVLVALQLCYRMPFLQTLYIMGISYAAQYVMYSCWLIGCKLITPNFDFYMDGLLYQCLYLSLIAITALFLRYALRIHQYMPEIGRFNPVVVMSFLIIIVIAASLTYHAIIMMDFRSFLILRACASLACVLDAGIAVLSLIYHQVKTEQAMQRYIMERQKTEYQLTQQTIESLNIKCHDLKYQMRMINEKIQSSERADLSEIENTIDQFQAIYHTGLDALDIIISEKARLCEQKGIAFSFMGDGTLMKPLRELDLYRLFNNAIDNAIEAVEKVEPEQRIISMSITRQGPFAAVHVENYYRDEVRLVGGMPCTTKADNRNHGFGVRSIKAIADQYHAAFHLKAEHPIFTLDLLFPLEN